METETGSSGLKIAEAIPKWRKELTKYLTEMNDFKTEEDIQLIIRKLSGYSARASRIRSESVRNKHSSSKLIRLIEDEIDPFISEVERQFRFFSRVQSTIDSEIALSR